MMIGVLDTRFDGPVEGRGCATADGGAAGATVALRG